MEKKILTLLAVVNLLLLNSCIKKDTEQQFEFSNDCDCKGEISTTVTDMKARLTVGKTLFLKDVDYGKVAYRELLLCDTLKITGLSASKEGEYNYVVSGELRPPCITNGVAYFWSINVSSISKR